MSRDVVVSDCDGKVKSWFDSNRITAGLTPCLAQFFKEMKMITIVIEDKKEKVESFEIDSAHITFQETEKNKNDIIIIEFKNKSKTISLISSSEEAETIAHNILNSIPKELKHEQN